MSSTTMISSSEVNYGKDIIKVFPSLLGKSIKISPFKHVLRHVARRQHVNVVGTAIHDMKFHPCLKPFNNMKLKLTNFTIRKFSSLTKDYHRIVLFQAAFITDADGDQQLKIINYFPDSKY
jgi:hypothetical protein